MRLGASGHAELLCIGQTGQQPPFLFPPYGSGSNREPLVRFFQPNMKGMDYQNSQPV